MVAGGTGLLAPVAAAAAPVVVNVAAAGKGSSAGLDAGDSFPPACSVL